MTSFAPIITCLSQVQPRSVDWLWPGRIAAGRITLIAGDPGLGKSWATLDIAARVSRCRDWPDGAHCKGGSVLLMNCEDGMADTIRPRLDLLEANTDRIFSLDGIQLSDESSIPVVLDHFTAIRDAVEQTRAKLLVIDPITGFFGAGADSGRDTYIRSVFRPIADLADSTGCAVIIVAHLNKSSDQAALYRFSGSVQYSGASRTAYYIGRDRGDHHRRLMMCVKNNLGRDRWALAYRIDPEHERSPVIWEPIEITSDDLEDVVTGQRETEDVREITEWLKRRVTDDRGVNLKSIQKEGKEAGWTWLQISRARRVLGIRQEHIGAEWLWVPADANPIHGRGWVEA